MISDWAFLGWSDGRILLGRGPFEACASAPGEGVAFYRNDFGLGVAEPWLVPASVEWLTHAEAAEAFPPSTPEVDWGELEATHFAEVFQEVSGAIRRGTFEKTVPVVVEEGRLLSGAINGLAGVAMGGESPLVAYGMRKGDAGFVGQSPEYLLRVHGRDLRTMALAGTARAEERDVLAVDEKEIREHEFVAQALVSKLGDLGELERGARGIMALGPIVHFHTPITVTLDREEEIDSLIKRLHPTPALGPLPRTAETMAALLGWRRRLGAPAEFGAPFGAVVDGDFQGIVSIRGLWWEGDRVSLPAGCGVIEPSRLVNEWRELRLKRSAVKARFGFVESAL
ncbi:chorismate-binding protein [Haloferula rosea]|uniref:Chorismate-binding protein n=1 Tax=Haloferula rosea TaxID=490093 RepID=A0A934RI50_9BACT|nr:chorismate-binding protein [Haloferula rosea]MBK1828951.1 chorismate-binding protein [Haloferula rosea]